MNEVQLATEIKKSIVRFEPAAVPAKKNGHPVPAMEQQLRYVCASHIGVEQRVFDDELIEGVIGKLAMAVLYGASNSGKTFLAIDIAGAIARASEWMGKRCIKGGVLYLATESSASVEMRLATYKRHHGITELNVFVVQSPINLFEGNVDMHRVVLLAEQIEREHGIEIVLVIGDTLARISAGANENSGEDMGRVLANAEQIREALKCSFLWIHHSGKNAAAGARGWSGIRAAIDTEIEVGDEAEEGTRAAEITKQRDLDGKGDRYGFTLQRVVMGTNRWGRERASCVVLPANAPEKKGKATPAIAGAVLAYLRERGKGARMAEIVEHFGGIFSRSSIFTHVGKLIQEGRLTKVGHVIGAPDV
jgi:hypothetical protein